MSPRSPTELVLKITLRESEPPIWRRVAVTDDLSLARLHDVIQIAMGWMDSHLHEFHVGDRTYGIPDPDFEDAAHRVFKENNRKLASFVEAGVDRFDYVYDFGDNWVHEVFIESAGPPQHDRRYPSFIDGARRCPPEDVGGIGGYFEFMHAIADPTHEDHEQMLTWVGGAYDPETFDRNRIELGFDMMANRSRANSASKARACLLIVSIWPCVSGEADKTRQWRQCNRALRVGINVGTKIEASIFIQYNQ